MSKKGIIHVGGHRGEEVSAYISARYSPIILFEPQPLKWEVPEGVTLVSCALSDHSGLMEMYIPHHLTPEEGMDTMSASGLGLIPAAARQNGWAVTPCEVQKVPMLRFDDWSVVSGYVKGSCDTLVIDVQGMEMQVLAGFGDHLGDFVYLKIECSDPPLYSGGASAREIISFLNQVGFCPKSPILRHGDIKFEVN